MHMLPDRQEVGAVPAGGRRPETRSDKEVSEMAKAKGKARKAQQKKAAEKGKGQKSPKR